MNEILDKDLHTSKRLKLEFTGQGSELFGIMFVNGLLSMLTLGIYYAWGRVKTSKYLYKNTKLEGHEFEYHATGIELFIGYLKAFFAIIAFYALLFGAAYLGKGQGIIMFPFALVVYTAIFALIGYAIHSSLKFETAKSSWKGIFWGYFGNAQELIGMFVKGIYLSIISLGIYSSWFTVSLRKYVLSNLRFGNITFEYSGNGKELFMINLKGFLLTIATIGIYGFWYMTEVYEYHAAHTKASQDGRQIAFKANFTGGELFGLVFVNIVLVIITLGFAFPWAICRETRFFLDNTKISGDFRADELEQVEHSYNNAIGSAILDQPGR